MQNKKFIIFGVTAVLLSFYGAFMVWTNYQADKTITTLQALITEKHGQLDIVPVPHTILTTTVQGPSSPGSLKNVFFTVPFVPTLTRNESENGVVYNGDAGKVLAFMKTFSVFDEKWKTYHNVQSDYDAYTRIHNITLAEVNSLQHSKQEKIRLTTLAFTKGGMTTPNTPLYSFSTSEVKGFQIGNPTTQTTISLELFDSSNGQYKYSILTGNLTQTEIDTILSSITIQ